MREITKKQNDLSIVEDKINSIDTEYSTINEEKNKLLSSINIKSDLFHKLINR